MMYDNYYLNMGAPNILVDETGPMYPEVGDQNISANQDGSRKRRGNLPRASVKMLKDWINEHKQNAYPTEGEKNQLAKAANITLLQVSNWFINARRRYLPKIVDNIDKVTIRRRRRPRENRRVSSSDAEQQQMSHKSQPIMPLPPSWEVPDSGPSDHDYETREASWGASSYIQQEQQPNFSNYNYSSNQSNPAYYPDIQTTHIYCYPQTSALNTPENSPLYSPSSPDSYIPQSEFSHNSGMMQQPTILASSGQVTPPPEEGESFALHILSDVAVSILEQARTNTPPQDTVDARIYLEL